MSPAAENVQQARRLIADLELPAEPCQADAHPNRAPESPLNNDQQAAVNRYHANQSMPDSWPSQICCLLYKILYTPLQRLLASIVCCNMLCLVTPFNLRILQAFQLIDIARYLQCSGGTICWKAQRLLAPPCKLLLETFLCLTQLG